MFIDNLMNYLGGKLSIGVYHFQKLLAYRNWESRINMNLQAETSLRQIAFLSLVQLSVFLEKKKTFVPKKCACSMVVKPISLMFASMEL